MLIVDSVGNGQVGATAGYLGLATYNLLGNEVARVGNVNVVGAVDGTAAPFDKTVRIGRGFTDIEAGPKVGVTQRTLPPFCSLLPLLTLTSATVD